METLDILSKRLKICSASEAPSGNGRRSPCMGRSQNDQSFIHLDLGTGKGTVALLLLSVLPNASAKGIEHSNKAMICA